MPDAQPPISRSQVRTGSFAIQDARFSIYPDQFSFIMDSGLDIRIARPRVMDGCEMKKVILGSLAALILAAGGWYWLSPNLAMKGLHDAALEGDKYELR